MITSAELVPAGRLVKTHGVKGEISATLSLDFDPADVKCIVVDIDGIYVPFFIESVRPKSAEAVLLTIDGIDSDAKALQMTGRDFFILRSDCPAPDEDADGLYASDLVGYSVVDSDLGPLGTITGINDATDNVLFIVRTPGGRDVLVPVADDLIDEIDTDTRTLHTSLPQGLIDLNN